MAFDKAEDREGLTITQISAASSRPRKICSLGCRVAAAARNPPACRPATTITKAAKNQ